MRLRASDIEQIGSGCETSRSLDSCRADLELAQDAIKPGCSGRGAVDNAESKLQAARQDWKGVL